MDVGERCVLPTTCMRLKDLIFQDNSHHMLTSASSDLVEWALVTQGTSDSESNFSQRLFKIDTLLTAFCIASTVKLCVCNGAFDKLVHMFIMRVTGNVPPRTSFLC